MRKLVVLVPLSLAVAAAPFAACRGGTGEPELDADVEDAKRDVVRSDSAIVPTPSPPQDASVDRPLGTNADGWLEVRLEDDYDCAFYAAPSPAKMPPPIAWEPCSAPLLAKWSSCRQVKVEWPRKSDALGGVSLSGSAAWVDATGRVWLAMNRVRDVDRLAVVGEADGVIHHAIVQENAKCSLYQPALQDGHVIWTAAECAGTPPAPDCPWHAGVGGAIDQFPRILVARPNLNYFTPGTSLFAESYVLRSWTDGGLLGLPPATSPASAPLSHGQSLVNDRLFYLMGDGTTYQWISHYALASGAREFISFGSDVAAWAGGFRSDGKDMVWVEAFGRSSPASQWSVINLMTAPFTTDPSGIQRRRVRSTSKTDLNGSHVETVGCGYASFYSPSSAHAIVRLSDGRSWELETVKGADAGADRSADGLVFRNVRAITCDEVFFEGYWAWDDKIVRIRLDDLGPGAPAD